MRILLADDERLARQRLRSLLEEIGGGLEVVAEAADGVEALKLCAREEPDLVMLDIRMPSMSGLDVACEFARMAQPPAVIFTTAYDEYALRAFDANALDYLLKPIRKERLKEALARAEVLSRARLAELARIRTAVSAGFGARSHICAQMHGEWVMIPLTKVLYFRADQKYVTVRTAAREVLIDDSLKLLEAEFAEGFVRVHRNALAALDHIERLERDLSGALTLKMRGVEERLEVSRRHAPAVRAALKRFKGGRV